MNDFGMFLSVDGFQQSGQCMECEKRGIPVLVIAERYFGDGATPHIEQAQICERCLPAYMHHMSETVGHELRAMFGRRRKRAAV